MSTLIIYATKYGFTQKCAEMIAQGLTENVDVCNIKLAGQPDLSPYDKVIVGSSVYAGRIRKEIRQFCTAKREKLKSKKLAFFICGMAENQAQAQITTAFPQELLSIASAAEFFGGQYKFDKMNFLERIIIKQISGSTKDVSRLNSDNINKLIQIMSQT
ncbi:MAG: flavodoxin [Firmicutes bacterium]|nr:flavodoxin [Bacillota bacterium]